LGRGPTWGDSLRLRSDAIAKRLLDLAVAGLLLVCLLPLVLVVAVALKVTSRGPVFYRSRRVGFRGEEMTMLKFRKMHEGASGVPLTASDDARFTRIGRFLAKSKIDEIPQLWNVLRGQMSLVGPLPEDAGFVELRPEDFSMILTVKPGITGLCQLAFAKESDILSSEDRVQDYVARLLPQKIALDRIYVDRRSMSMDLRILAWTVLVVLLRRDVAVHRSTMKLTLRRRPKAQTAAITREGANA
jgi:lipopolysaccharide/colanic/teichoic acid biosynthesis glycosyltransferase